MYTIRSIRITNHVNVSHHGLANSHHDIPLQHIMDDVLNRLHTQCTALPNEYSSIQWSHMNSTVLGYTIVNFIGQNPTNYYSVLNSGFDWHDGPCSEKPGHSFDVKTVVLHEVMHGIGFLSTIDQSKTAFPIKYDLLLADSGNNKLVDSNIFTGDFGQPVYIDGVRIYNPVQFDEGTSLSHLDDMGRTMSGYMSHGHCLQEPDHRSQQVLNQLGYGCGVHVDTPIGTVAGVVAGLIVVAIIVTMAMTTTKRKKRTDFQTPLLA